MDVENMHPFCLPFGLCHDATSSNMTADFEGNNNNNNNNNSNNNNNLEDSIISDRMRCQTLSPSDDFLFKQSPADEDTSLLLRHHHDLIDIGSPTKLADGGGSSGSIYSLECDINIDDNETSSLIDIDSTGRGSIMFGSGADQEVEIKADEHELDSWYCSQFSSLFSPPLSSTSHHHLQDHHHLESSNSNRKKSLIRMAINNQVFHNLVDPLDIKSSPTLAQLNLNSNDDPPDSLWTASCMHNCTSIISNNNNNNTSAHNHNHNHHNSSHIHGYSGSSAGTSDLLTGSCCNSTGLSHHYHQHQFLPGARNHHIHHHDHNSMTSICHYLQHHHHGHNHHQLAHNHAHPYHHELQLTGLAPMPASCQTEATIFANNNHSKKLYPPNQLSLCCLNNNNNNNNFSVASETATSQPANAPNQLENNPHLTKPNSSSTTPGAANGVSQMTSANHCNSWLLSMVNMNNKHCNQQIRSASPALVTSSSSPLSSTENKQVDNKLKENIDYLTALLCNGNKQLDTGSGAQTPSISSTMVRSYATLAHSLSSSSKLLENPADYLQQQLPVHSAQQQQPLRQLPTTVGSALSQNASIMSTTTGSLAPTNEASSHETQINTQQQQQQMNLLKRCYPTTPVDQQQWFKSSVESSVSAADSTDSLNSRAKKQHHNHCHGTMEVRQIAVDKQQQQQQQQAPENKVLSSLLSSNKCSSSVVTQLSDVTSHQKQFNADHWQQEQQQQQQFNSSESCEQASNKSALEQSADHQTKLVTDASTPLNNDHNNTSSRQQQQRVHQQLAPLAAGQDESIPVNGKPITLKPHSNQNGIIVQQSSRPLYPQSGLGGPVSVVQVQHQQVTTLQAPAPPPPSHQPPPAAAAGAASNANELLSSSLSLPVAASAPASKKPRRLAKQSSLDCASQSSYDDGFLSQVDNDECASQRDSDEEEDIDSDDESFYGDYSNSDLIGASISDNAENKWTLNMGRTRRNGQKRYFWQYNVQSKGPKGARMCSADDFEDPFVLPEASDPVFSNDCHVEGVKHSGKARRGDGNDLTPNPRKLLMIGLELKKLGKIINELAPVTELPVNARNKTRKEKNKLASRACRLKKKAQHEANKIKLYGLQREHQQVVMAIYDVRKLLNESLSRMDSRDSSLKGDSSSSAAVGHQNSSGSTSIQQQQQQHNNGQQQEEQVSPSVQRLAEQCSMTVAGQTSDYVNSVLEKVVSGFIDGGLQT